MDELIDVLLSFGIMIVIILVYILFRGCKRLIYKIKWKDLAKYCNDRNYSLGGWNMHRSEYAKELSRTEVLKMLQSYGIKIVLPHDLRFFDIIILTYAKPYMRYLVGHSARNKRRIIGESKVYRFITMMWFENGRWIGSQDLRRFKSCVYSDIGGIGLFPEDTDELVEEKIDCDLRQVLFNLNNQVERWNREHDNDDDTFLF